MSFFQSIEILPEDPIFSIPRLFKADTHLHKVNLGIGAYQDEQGQSYVLPTVCQAEQCLLPQNLTKDYLPIGGYPEFIEESLKLIFASDWLQEARPRIFAAQSLGGAGALSLGGELLSAHISRHIAPSLPTWPNHQGIFKRVGFTIDPYPYYDANTRSIPFDQLCASLRRLPPNSVVLLQACCHNPTGLDFNWEQWQELSQLIRQRQLVPFFDIAYQGFGQSLAEDVQAVRYFAKQGHEMLIAYSFSKNMGLYGDRVGLFCAVTDNPEAAKRVQSQILRIIRSSYSNPPTHGARLVALILRTPELFSAWQSELSAMRQRVDEMRQAFISGLADVLPTQPFDHLSQRRGLFFYTGLSREQVYRLRNEKGIYLVEDGRMNLAGLNPSNKDYVIHSIAAILS